MPGRLHVLIVSAWYPSPEDQVSGVFVRDQARAASRCSKVTVLAQSVRDGPRDGSDEGVRVLRVVPFERTGLLGNIQRLIAVNAAVRQLIREGAPPDVIHGHIFFGAFPAVVVGRARRLPVIVSEHYTGLVERRLVWRERLIARFTYRFADLVCPVSEMLRDRIAALQPHGTYEVVGNPVDVDAFAGRERPPKHASGPRLITVAGLYPKKGIPYLLDAVRHLLRRFPDSTLRIVGDGPDRPMLEALASNLPVEFLGGRPRAELVKLMGEADVFVSASVAETFGIAPLEALAAGLPVVATSACPVAGLISQLGGLIVPPADPLALSEALSSALTAPAVGAVDAADHVRRKFGLDVTARRWDAIYRKVIAARGPTRVRESEEPEESENTMPIEVPPSRRGE